MTVLVDPWSLTWKGDFSDLEAAEAYVERLTNMFDLSKQEVVSLVISDESAELLVADNVYPLVAQLPEPFWPNRSDVYRLVAALLEKLPKLSQIGVTAILVGDVSRSPEVEFTISPKHAAYIDDLAAIALVAHERSLVDVPPILSAHAAESAIHEISLSVEDVECVSMPEGRTGRYEGLIRIRPSVSDCVRDLRPVDLVLRGYVEQAIAVQLWNDLGSVGSNPFTVVGWSFGSDLTRTLGDCGILANRGRVEAFLRSCSKIVRGDDLRITHALRKTPAGGSDQVTRISDNAAAWRADIDYEYHLHYWLAGRHVEFANVVVHNDFGITS